MANVTIGEFITRCGGDVSVQFLKECVVNATVRKDGICKVTFETTKLNPNHILEPDAAPFVGLVTWIPMADYQRVMNELMQPDRALAAPQEAE